MTSKMKVYQRQMVDVCIRRVVMGFFPHRYQFLFPCKIRENESHTFFKIFSVLQNIFGT